MLPVREGNLAMNRGTPLPSRACRNGRRLTAQEHVSLPSFFAILSSLPPPTTREAGSALCSPILENRPTSCASPSSAPDDGADAHPARSPVLSSAAGAPPNSARPDSCMREHAVHLMRSVRSSACLPSSRRPGSGGPAPSHAFFRCDLRVVLLRGVCRISQAHRLPGPLEARHPRRA